MTDLPVIDSSRVDAETSAERDAQASGQVYDVDVETLRAVEPDVILTQSVCGVCAVDEALVERELADLAVDPTVVGLSASELADVYDCILEVGTLLDRGQRAAELVTDLRERVTEVDERTDAAEARPDVVVLEWMDPLHVAANWVPELVTAAGGAYPLATAGERSVETDWATVREADPDVLVVAPCSYDAEKTRDRLSELADRPGWEDLAAVATDRVYTLDGRVLNRWTPRLVDELERLATVIQPDLFDRDPQATPLAP